MSQTISVSTTIKDMLLSLVLLRAAILVFRQKSKTGAKQLR